MVREKFHWFRRLRPTQNGTPLPSRPAVSARRSWTAVLSLLSRFITQLKRLASAIWKMLGWILDRFQLTSAVSRNSKQTSESLKDVSGYSRLRALGHCTVQILPITVTGIILSLNFPDGYWEDVGAANQNAKLNALQFAAKTHEVLIVASLSAIVLHHVQYELFRGRGVAFGGLFAGFQVADLTCLWSPGLWASGCTDGKLMHRALFVLLIVISVTLGAIVGPSSAIIVLPSLDWWDLSISNEDIARAFNWEGTDAQFYISANKSSIWPTDISIANGLQVPCDSVPYYCPTTGPSEIVTWASNLGSWETWVGAWNISLGVGNRFLGDSLAQPFGPVPQVRFLEGVTVEVHDGLQPPPGRDDGYFYTRWLSLTQTSYEVVSNVLTEFSGNFVPQLHISDPKSTRWRLSLPNGNTPLSPQTQVICMGEDNFPSYLNDTQLSNHTYIYPQNSSVWSDTHLLLPDFTHLPFPALDNEYWYSDASQLEAFFNNTNSTEVHPRFLWAEPPDLGDNTPSIGLSMLSFIEDVRTVDGDPAAHPSISYGLGWTTCSIFASWRPLDVYIDPNTDNYVHFSRENSIATKMANWRLNEPPESGIEKIKIGADWAILVLPPNEILAELCLTLESSLFFTETFGQAVSILVTDALARLGTNNINGRITGDFAMPGGVVKGLAGTVLASASATNPGNSTAVKLTRLRFGYSYSMRGLTRRLAAGILLAHVLIALIYMAVVFYSGWICLGLKSLHEVLALAINSARSQALANTCAGIARLEAYKLMVQVREVEDQHLGLVVNEDGATRYERPVEGKMYGLAAGNNNKKQVHEKMD